MDTQQLSACNRWNLERGHWPIKDSLRMGNARLPRIAAAITDLHEIERRLGQPDPLYDNLENLGEVQTLLNIWLYDYADQAMPAEPLQKREAHAGLVRCVRTTIPALGLVVKHIEVPDAPIPDYYYSPRIMLCDVINMFQSNYTACVTAEHDPDLDADPDPDPDDRPANLWGQHNFPPVLMAFHIRKAIIAFAAGNVRGAIARLQYALDTFEDDFVPTLPKAAQAQIGDPEAVQ